MLERAKLKQRIRTCPMNCESAKVDVGAVDEIILISDTDVVNGIVISDVGEVIEDSVTGIEVSESEVNEMIVIASVGKDNDVNLEERDRVKSRTIDFLKVDGVSLAGRMVLDMTKQERD
ncbi:1184_t:CDS:2 [Ambispora gerdemannii]|uniref:1184_t:CDS:1 n=1 Tax=Ambispora gerdemannii TaxID=144530 RepID=A0A9N9FQ95_9GLOM|nr:1184_t:CDS:2 [Ambispora gerdemannii]